MADYLAPLPVSTQNAGDVIAKICDATTTSQQLSVDASGRVGVSYLVGVTGAGQAAMAASIPVVIASDQSDINVDVPNNFLGITTTGQAVMASSFPVVLSSDHSDINVDVPNNLLGITTKGQATMANSLPVVISSDQSAIDVNVVSSVATSPVHDYDTVAAVAGGGSSNHDYTVSGGTFYVESVFVTASGRIKAELRTGPIATLVSQAVGFNSAGSPGILFEFPNEIPVADTDTVRIVRSNREAQAFDVYSFINGHY